MIPSVLSLKVGAIAAGVAMATGIGLGGAAVMAVYKPRLEAAVSNGKANAERLKREHSNEVAAAALRHAAELNAARETEKALRDDLAAAQSTGEKEKARVQAEAERVITDLRAGTRRLSIAVRSCTASTPSSEAGRGASAAGGGGGQKIAELDTETSERILRITRDGDGAIVSLNTCIDAYEAVRFRINGGPYAPAR